MSVRARRGVVAAMVLIVAVVTAGLLARGPDPQTAVTAGGTTERAGTSTIGGTGTAPRSASSGSRDDVSGSPATAPGSTVPAADSPSGQPRDATTVAPGPSTTAATLVEDPAPTQPTTTVVADPPTRVVTPDQPVWGVLDPKPGGPGLTLFSAPSAAHAVHVDRDHAIWFLDGSVLSRFDLRTRELRWMFGPLFKEGRDLAVGRDGVLWFTAQLSYGTGWVNALFRVDTSTNVVTSQLTDLIDPRGLLVARDGSVWWGTNGGAMGAVERFDPVVGERRKVPIPQAAAVDQIVLGPDDGIWVTTNDGSLVRVEQATGAITPRPDVPRHAWRPAAVGADGGLWLVSSLDRVIVRVDVDAGTSELLTLDPASEAGPLALVSGPDGAIWVLASNTGRGQLLRVDPSTRALRTIDLGVQAFNSWLVVADDAIWFAYWAYPDGGIAKYDVASQ